MLRRTKTRKLNWKVLENGQLFERKCEIDQLVKAFSRRLKPDSKPELIVISGNIGTGKTTLASKIRRPAKEKNAFVISKNFCQMKRLEPYTPLVSAMTDFIKLIVEEGREATKQAKGAILKAIGNDIGALIAMIPQLEELIGNQGFNVLKGEDIENRLKIAFCKFVHAVSTASRPLVLIFDDLQWADVWSLEVIETIVSDPNNHKLVVVGICRSDELSSSNQFANVLLSLEDKKNTTITNIFVPCLSLKATKALVSSVLLLTQDECWHIIDALYKKTKGNTFFLILLLRALYDYRVLISSDGIEQWQWDDQAWTANFKNVNDAVDLVAKRIERIPLDCLPLLYTSASLGAELDDFLLSKLLQDIDVTKALLRCSAEDIIIKDKDTLPYRFFHDQIRQASYCLMPEKERASFHMSIARRLVKSLSEHEINKYIFVIADQIIRGVGHFSNNDEKYELLSFLLRAGQNSISLHGFKMAYKYLQAGLQLLDLPRDWKARYSLTLSLHNALIKASCCTASFAEMDLAVESLYAHAKSFDEKLEAIILLIYSLGIRYKLSYAIELGLTVLEELEEGISRKRPKIYLISKILQLKMMLRNKTDSAILNLPEMTNQKKISSLRVLNLLLVNTYMGKSDLFPVVVLLMLKLTLQYGISALSSVAFVSYGLLQNHIGNFDAGYRFGKLGLKLLDRYGTAKDELIPRVYLFFHSTIAPWKEPLRNQIEPLLQAHRIGLKNGDSESAFLAKFFYAITSFHSGALLPSQEANLCKISNEMCGHKNKSVIEFLSFLHEAILVLMKKEDSLVVTNGILMHLEKGSTKLAEIMDVAKNELEHLLSVAFYYRLIVSYYLGEFDIALAMATKCEQTKVSNSTLMSRFRPFYEGMTIVTMIHQRRFKSTISRMKLLSRGHKQLNKLRSFAKHCAQNCQHEVLLLEAEFEVINGQVETALDKYKESISLATQEGYINIKALALERIGIVLYDHFKGKKLDAIHSLELSAESYRKWGAFAKVEQIEQLIATYSEKVQLTAMCSNRIN